MKNLIKLLLHPDAATDEKGGEAYKQQARSLKRVWEDSTYGIERIVRLFLCAVQFFFPILLVRDIFGRMGLTFRKLAVEIYTVLKLVFPLMVLIFGLYQNPIVILVIIYLLIETILHILNLIFLSDIYSISVSFRRSILLLFLHYIEVVLDFATIYIGFDLLNQPLTPVSAVYFSTVANTTVGFGDIVAKAGTGQVVVISQLMVGILFVFLFITYFSQKLNDK